MTPVHSRRIDRLEEELSALERALHFLHTRNAGRPRDSRIVDTMPDDQVPEFRRLIKRLRGIEELGPMVDYLGQAVARSATKLALLGVLAAWSAERTILFDYIFKRMPEPCSFEEFEQYRSQERARYCTISEATEIVIAARGLGSGDRLARSIRKELQTIVDASSLPTEGRGSRMRINVGALCDLFACPVPVLTSMGARYEIVPPEELPSKRASREHLRVRIELGPHWLAEVLPGAAAEIQELLPDDQLTVHDVRAKELAEQLRKDLVEQSQLLAALELLTHEARVELGGEDPMPPELRDSMDRARTDLLAVREQAGLLLGEVVVTAPDDQLESLLRTLARAK